MRRSRERRTCPQCAGAFEAKPSDPKRFCTPGCYQAHLAAERAARPATECAVDGCDRPALCRGLCNMHYQRCLRNGEPGPVERVDYSGSGNPNWKGGRVRGGDGRRYWLRHVPDHPAASVTGYVLEHRLVVEERIGRYLTAEEVVHHVNEDSLDNRDENLVLCANQAEHMEHHKTRRARQEVA